MHIHPFTDFDFLAIRDMKFLPKPVQYLYYDLRISFCNPPGSLVAPAICHLMYAICSARDIKGKSLRLNLNKLEKAGPISMENLYVIHRFCDVDPYYWQENRAYDTHQLKEVLEIINHLLRMLFIIPAGRSKRSIKKSSRVYRED